MASSIKPLDLRKRTRRWRSSYEKPTRRGWYECKARDDRWNGQTQWRAWGRGMWWIPLGKGDGSDGWLSSPMRIYQWRGPAHDVMGPPPNARTELRLPGSAATTTPKI